MRYKLLIVAYHIMYLLTPIFKDHTLCEFQRGHIQKFSTKTVGFYPWCITDIKETAEGNVTTIHKTEKLLDIFNSAGEQGKY